ncbi:G-protein coupled receptor moody-like [Tubulanus polymorphus]|uniref:G-protein coupled receptor moody-like n=1 Tax=Tubulanus polymorphus TaxID=672921 RepID=UPI003DA46302
MYLKRENVSNDDEVATMLNSNQRGQNDGWTEFTTSALRALANFTDDADDVREMEINRDNRDWNTIYPAVGIMAVIILIALPGNAIVITAFHKCKTLRTPSNLFLLNLAVCDLLTVSLLPFTMYTFIANQWQFDGWICKFVAFVTSMLPGTTLMSISFIAWNRYMLVTNPATYRRLFTANGVKWMIVTTWSLPATILILPLFEIWGAFAFVPIMATCNLRMNHESQSYKLTLYLVRAGAPCLLIVYCYCYIYRKMRRSHSKIRNIVSNAQSHSLLATKQEQHLTKMTAAIFAVFIVSYFPCTITTIVDWNNDALSKKYHMFCQITVYLSCAVNPFVYGLMNSQFNDAFYETLCCDRNGAVAAAANCRKKKTPQNDVDVDYDKIQGDQLLPAEDESAQSNTNCTSTALKCSQEHEPDE